jgi:hypothetical protein
MNWSSSTHRIHVALGSHSNNAGKFLGGSKRPFSLHGKKLRRILALNTIDAVLTGDF